MNLSEKIHGPFSQKKSELSFPLRVTNIVDFGFFVENEEGKEVMYHISKLHSLRPLLEEEQYLLIQKVAQKNLHKS